MSRRTDKEREFLLRHMEPLLGESESQKEETLRELQGELKATGGVVLEGLQRLRVSASLEELNEAQDASIRALRWGTESAEEGLWAEVSSRRGQAKVTTPTAEESQKTTALEQRLEALRGASGILFERETKELTAQPFEVEVARVSGLLGRAERPAVAAILQREGLQERLTALQTHHQNFAKALKEQTVAEEEKAFSAKRKEAREAFDEAASRLQSFVMGRWKKGHPLAERILEGFKQAGLLKVTETPAKTVSKPLETPAPSKPSETPAPAPANPNPPSPSPSGPK